MIVTQIRVLSFLSNNDPSIAMRQVHDGTQYKCLSNQYSLSDAYNLDHNLKKTLLKIWIVTFWPSSGEGDRGAVKVRKVALLSTWIVVN